MAETPLRHENYQMSEEFTRENMSQRTAQGMADFLLPHLRAGMRLLECGCGQGTVTIDLAELVAPDEVVGIDLREGDLDRARALAAQQKTDIGDAGHASTGSLSVDAALMSCYVHERGTISFNKTVATHHEPHECS